MAIFRNDTIYNILMTINVIKIDFVNDILISKNY